MVLSGRLSVIRITLGALVLGAGLAGLTASTAVASPESTIESAILPLPGPNQFVSGLDLDCFTTPGPRLDMPINLRHLNPVLIGLRLPPHQVIVRELQQTCVPVEKNGRPPHPAAAPFIRQVAFGCYRVEASPQPAALRLQHMNPVLAGLPGHDVVLIRPEQLCVPMSLNGAPIPPEVLRLVQFIDIECYSTDPIGVHPSFILSLRQLHPELVGMAPHPLSLVSHPRQMCVPVVKNNQPIPFDVLAIAQWVDLEKFTASPNGSIPPFFVTLHHLNPLLVARPPFRVTLQQVAGLLVPVAKNGAAPPLP
jgi:hypothetical protein